MRSLYLAILAIALSAVSAAPAGDVPGKGFPLHTAASAQHPVKQTVTAKPIAMATPVAAVPAAEVSPQTSVKFEDQPMQFPTGDRRRSRTSETREFRMPSILPALFSVLVVCGLFVTVLYLIKKYLPGHRQMFAHPAMEFLGRTHLDQKRFVSLLRVGRRIVVVGVSSDDMQTLSEITDEAEVTEILEVARPKTESGLTMFQKLFQRNVVDLEAVEARADAEAKAAELDEQMSTIRERVKSIHQDEKKQTAAAPARRRVDAVG